MKKNDVKQGERMDSKGKKLVLNRETVRALTAEQLGQAAGGVSAVCPSIYTVCG